MFEKNGKFLIAENGDLFDDVELAVFEPKYLRYEPCYDYDDFFDFIGETLSHVFIKNALITVGAEELCQVIEPQISRLRQLQESTNNQYSEWRALDETEPKYIIEIYKIKKDYMPDMVREIKSNNIEITVSLPENKAEIKSGQRMAYVAKDISTGKIIVNSIHDTIESIKYNKWLKKNPPLMDLEDALRMELDSDDPNFLSWDEFTKTDDDYEEGDDEYTPGANYELQ